MRKEAAAYRRGSALILVVFVIALAAAMVMGMLQLNTEQTLQLRNQIGFAQASAIAEAGLNDALAQLRSDIHWSDGFSGKPFDGGQYTVSITGSAPRRTIMSLGRSEREYTVRMEARIRAAGSQPPYHITIERIRINP